MPAGSRGPRVLEAVVTYINLHQLGPAIAAGILVVLILAGVVGSMALGYRLAGGDEARMLREADRRLDSLQTRFDSAGAQYVAECWSLLPHRGSAPTATP